MSLSFYKDYYIGIIAANFIIKLFWFFNEPHIKILRIVHRLLLPSFKPHCPAINLSVCRYAPIDLRPCNTLEIVFINLSVNTVSRKFMQYSFHISILESQRYYKFCWLGHLDLNFLHRYYIIKIEETIQYKIILLV